MEREVVGGEEVRWFWEEGWPEQFPMAVNAWSTEVAERRRRLR